jgi:hypothetical protein
MANRASDESPNGNEARVTESEAEQEREMTMPRADDGEDDEGERFISVARYHPV